MNNVTKVKRIIDQYKGYLPALFFVLGFIFDLLTIDRIDDPIIIGQQIGYLVLIAALLLHSLSQEVYESQWKWDRAKNLALHFMFGALLSSYTIFYFKSSSAAVSFIFILLLAGLLVANELSGFQKMGLELKFALFALSLFSFFAYFIPMLSGKVGSWIFIAALSAASLLIGCMAFATYRFLNEPKVLQKILRPTAIVLVIFSSLYFLRWIPPVPLSIQHIGVYHTLEKSEEGQYKLGYRRAWWKFWQDGAQSFNALPNEAVIIFFRIFSPSDFEDEVSLQWYFYETSGWAKYDNIPIQIIGGRGLGFRGYGIKKNFAPGHWRVAVMTEDQREIGSIVFKIELVSEPLEELHYEFH